MAMRRGPRKRAKAGPGDARQQALGLLARREQSARELKRKLTHRGFEAEESDAAVADLARDRYQSDERFAEALIRQRAAGGYGPRHVEAELRQHGIDPRAHREALAAPDWRAIASAQLRRRFGSAALDREVRLKAAQFLARRGFGADTVRAVTRVVAEDD